MTPKTQNTTMSYEAVKVEGTPFSLEFAKSVRDNRTHISGTPKKDGMAAGFVSYKPEEDTLTVSLKNFKGAEQIKAVLAAIAESIAEIEK